MDQRRAGLRRGWALACVRRIGLRRVETTFGANGVFSGDEVEEAMVSGDAEAVGDGAGGEDDEVPSLRVCS